MLACTLDRQEEKKLNVSAVSCFLSARACRYFRAILHESATSTVACLVVDSRWCCWSPRLWRARSPSFSLKVVIVHRTLPCPCCPPRCVVRHRHVDDPHTAAKRVHAGVRTVTDDGCPRSARAVDNRSAICFPYLGFFSVLFLFLLVLLLLLLLLFRSDHSTAAVAFRRPTSTRWLRSTIYTSAGWGLPAHTR